MISFAVGTGRCGTKFLYQVLEKEPFVASSHEKHPLSDTFHRYCKWYDLPVDHEGFLVEKEKSIKEDLKNHDFSFESSAYLSFSIHELFQRFNSKFILLVRKPDKVVNSYFTKGWYEQTPIINDSDLIPSYQPSKLFHHFLGRTFPKGDEYHRWNSLTRIGKLAWFWKTLNAMVLKQFDEIPESNRMIVRLEDLDFKKYKEITGFLGFETTIRNKDYINIVNKKPNSFNNNRDMGEWTKKEETEFFSEVSELASKFNYLY